jgi:hypothetical protein
MAKRTLLFIVMLGIFGVGLWYVRTHYTPPSANQVDQFTELPLPSPVGKATVVPSPILTPSPGFVTFQLAITAPRVAIPLFSGWIFESSTTTFFYQHNEEVPDVQLRITAAKKRKARGVFIFPHSNNSATDCILQRSYSDVSIRARYRTQT